MNLAALYAAGIIEPLSEDPGHIGGCPDAPSGDHIVNGVYDVSPGVQRRIVIFDVGELLYKAFIVSIKRFYSLDRDDFLFEIKGKMGIVIITVIEHAKIGCIDDP